MQFSCMFEEKIPYVELPVCVKLAKPSLARIMLIHQVLHLHTTSTEMQAQMRSQSDAER
jgi:hypothetical protein